MKSCAQCGEDANPAVYKPADMRRALCRSCASPQGQVIQAFVKGGGSASNYREPSGPVVKRNVY